MASSTEKLLITFLPIAKKMLVNSAARSWLPREFLDYSRAKIGKTDPSVDWDDDEEKLSL